MAIQGPVRYLCYDFGGGLCAYFKEQLVSPYGWARAEVRDLYWSVRPIKRRTWERARAKGLPTRRVVVGFRVGDPPRRVEETGGDWLREWDGEETG